MYFLIPIKDGFGTLMAEYGRSFINNSLYMRKAKRGHCTEFTLLNVYRIIESIVQNLVSEN